MPQPRNPEPDPTAAPPAPAPAPAPDVEPPEPSWVSGFFERLDQRIATITATLTDDDRESIASRVHGLFESSGAFHPPEPEEPEEESQEAPQRTDEPPHKKTVAERLGFPRY